MSSPSNPDSGSRDESLGGAGDWPAEEFAPRDVVAGHFEIVKTLGRGGMGVVYLAHNRTDGSDVALKAVLPEYTADADRRAQFNSQFKSEIAVAKKLTHPNLCRVYDVHVHAPESPSEVLLLAMELVEGRTLTSWIHTVGKLDPKQALAIALQLASGLEALHQRGFVHRDLKSGNIMVTGSPDTGPERVVIMDFGLTRAAPTGAALTADSTVPGTAGVGLAGTMIYMAPEQLKRQPATSASDIYSFGLILYEMLTGHLPLAGGDSFAAAIRRMTDPIPPPSNEAPGIDACWDAALLGCLHVDPNLRFPSVQHVIRALECAPAPVLTPTLPPARTPSRSRARFAWGLIAVLLLLAASAASLPSLRMRLALLSGAHGTRDSDAYASYARAKELFDYRRVDSEPDLKRVIESFDDAIKRDPAFAAAIARRAYAYRWMSRFRPPEAASWKDRATFEIRKAEELDPDSIDVRLMKGSILTDEARTPAELPAAEKELRAALKANPHSDEAYKKLSTLYQKAGDDRKALEAARNAVREEPHFFDNYIAVGTAAFRLCDLKTAREAYDKVTGMVPHRTEGWNGLGVVRSMLGDFDGSVRALERAITEGAGGARLYSNLGTAYFYKGDYPNAERLMRKAAQLNPGSHIAAGNLADVLRASGQSGPAKKEYELAISLANDNLKRNRNDPDTLSSLAMYCARAGRILDARDALASLNALAISRPQLAYNTAAVYAILHDDAAAIQNLDIALNTCGTSANMALREPDFARLKSDPRFERVVRSRLSAH